MFAIRIKGNCLKVCWCNSQTVFYRSEKFDGKIQEKLRTLSEIEPTNGLILKNCRQLAEGFSQKSRGTSWSKYVIEFWRGAYFCSVWILNIFEGNSCVFCTGTSCPSFNVFYELTSGCLSRVFEQKIPNPTSKSICLQIMCPKTTEDTEQIPSSHTSIELLQIIPLNYIVIPFRLPSLYWKSFFQFENNDMQYISTCSFLLLNCHWMKWIRLQHLKILKTQS